MWAHVQHVCNSSWKGRISTLVKVQPPIYSELPKVRCVHVEVDLESRLKLFLSWEVGAAECMCAVPATRDASPLLSRYGYFDCDLVSEEPSHAYHVSAT